MKNKKIALLGTFSLVFISALAAAGSTYAWYQTNRSGSANFGGATIENQDAELKLTFIGSENGLTDKTPTKNNEFEFDYINRVTDVSGDGINFYKPFWSSKREEAVAINKVDADGHYVDLFFKIERINQPGITDGWGLKVYLGEGTKFEALDPASSQDTKSLEALRFAVVGYDNASRLNPEVKFVHAPFWENNAKYIARTSSYSAANVQAIISAKEAAIAAIESATDVAGVAGAKNSGVTAIIGVPRAEPADPTEAAKLLASAVINAEVKALNEDDYESADWSAILGAQTAALDNIEGAADAGAVATAKQNGLDAIALIEKIEATEEVAAAKEAAEAALNAHYDVLVQSDYNVTDWAAIGSAKTVALGAIGGASDISAIISAKNDGLSAISDLQSSKEAAKLANVKAAAVSVINAEVEALDVADYEASKWTEITDAQTAALDAIDDATVIGDVTSAKNDGVNVINAVLPEVAYTLAEAKAIAIDVIDEQVGGLVPANYSLEEWAAIEAEQEDAIENIQFASSVGVVKNVKIAGSEKIYAIQPSLPVAALTLAKQAAIAEVAVRVETLNAAHTYSDDSWGDIIAAQEVAFDDIIAASDLDDINEAKTEGFAALNAVIPLVTADDLIAAKKAAISVINSLVDEIGRVAYNQPGYVLNDQELLTDAFVTAQKQSEAGDYEIADLMTENEAFVAFRVWIEGTDKDATLVDGMHGTNGSLGGMFKFNLDIYALTRDVWED